MYENDIAINMERICPKTAFRGCAAGADVKPNCNAANAPKGLRGFNFDYGARIRMTHMILFISLWSVFKTRKITTTQIYKYGIFTYPTGIIEEGPNVCFKPELKYNTTKIVANDPVKDKND
jgi:hypothetical protein